MALIINRSGLINSNGGQPLPDTGLWVRFEYRTSRNSLNVQYEIFVALNQQDENKWSDIQVAWEDEVNEDGNIILSKRFLQKKFNTINDLAAIGAIEIQVNQMMPSASAFLKVLAGQHIQVANAIQQQLGQGTVGFDFSEFQPPNSMRLANDDVELFNTSVTPNTWEQIMTFLFG